MQKMINSNSAHTGLKLKPHEPKPAFDINTQDAAAEPRFNKSSNLFLVCSLRVGGIIISSLLHCADIPVTGLRNEVNH